MKELVFCVAMGCVTTVLMAVVANSSGGFTEANLAQASTGIRALMHLMMDYKAAAYVGIPTGFVLFGLSKLLRLELARTFFGES